MFKRTSVLFAWSISYAALLLLLVLFGITLKVNTQFKFQEEYKNITQSLQHQANQSINEYFTAMQKRAYNLANDYVINSFSGLSNPYGAPYYNLLPIQRTLKYECLSAQENIEIYLYCKNIDRALSSKTILNVNDFYTALYGNKEYDEQYFASLFKSFHYNEVFVVEHENSRANNVLMLTSFPLPHGTPNATIVQALSNTDLQKVLEQRLLLENSTSVLLNSQGKIVCATGASEPVDELALADLSDMQRSEIKLCNKNYWLLQGVMNNTGWKIVTVLPMTEFAKKSAWIGKLMVPLMLLFLAIGVICVGVLLWLNYTPLRKLREWCSSDTEQGNEYSNITFALKNMRNDLERMEALQAKQAAYLLDEFLSSCLDRELETDEAQMRQLFAQIKVKFVGNWFAVVILEFLVDDDHDIKLNRDAFLSDFKETSGNDFAAYWLSNKQNDILILNFSDKYCGECISKTVVKSLSHIADTSKNLDLLVCASALYEGLSQIYFAHLQASEQLMQRKLLMDKCSSDANQCEKAVEHVVIRFPQEQKNLLMRYIKAKNQEESQKVLDIVYSRNFADEALSLTVCKCLAQDILISMLRMFDDEDGFYHSIEDNISHR
ncbi:MAG: hypothetical protein RR234_07875, partial [Christensenella sp.]